MVGWAVRIQTNKLWGDDGRNKMMGIPPVGTTDHAAQNWCKCHPCRVRSHISMLNTISFIKPFINASHWSLGQNVLSTAPSRIQLSMMLCFLLLVVLTIMHTSLMSAAHLWVSLHLQIKSRCLKGHRVFRFFFSHANHNPWRWIPAVVNESASALGFVNLTNWRKPNVYDSP